MTHSTSPITPTHSDPSGSSARVGILHGAGYVGGELIQLVEAHPEASLGAVTSRTYAGEPVATAHPSLRGRIEHTFIAPDALELDVLDAILVAGEHGQSMHLVPDLLDAGFEGPIVDLSADFRFGDASLYPTWFDVEHPAPDLLDEAVYGLAEWSDVGEGARLVANPGCYATGISLALAPLAAHSESVEAHVTALTGASGSGATVSSATHFPTRDGNVRPYKVLDHQHEPEILQVLGEHVSLDFVPASGPWTRGIWGTAQVSGVSDADRVTGWYEEAYVDAPFVRLSPGELPSLQPSVGTPFCDVGWHSAGDTLVVGFALDNLLKGAASQAVQNLNRSLGFPETLGLLPSSLETTP